MNPPGLVKFDDASPDDIAKVIKNSPTKSCLLDPWPTFLLKDCLDILLPYITKLVNCSLSEGAVLDGFTSAVVTPLIKKSSLSKDDLKNYHPVSGLSFISKLMERVVASQLSEQVSLHGLENENQSACNSLFRGLSVSNLRKLQCIQNSLARIVCRATCLSHTTPLRKALHWLPIRRVACSRLPCWYTNTYILTVQNISAHFSKLNSVESI